MPAAAGITIRSYLWFNLKWILLFLPTVMVGAVLIEIGYPVLVLPLLVVFVVFYWRSWARFFRPMRGRIVRRVGGYAEGPRTLRDMIVGMLATAALVYLFVLYGLYILLAFFGASIVFALLRPFAIRYGWFGEGRITAYLHRPRFIDEQFHASADPMGKG